MSFDRRRGDDDAGAGLPDFLLDPMGVARRRWLPAVAALAAGVLVTFVLAAMWKPSYVAGASILITRQQIPEEFVRSTVREDSVANVNAMVGKVLSAENMKRIIDQLGLAATADDDVALRDVINGVREKVEIGPMSERGRSRHEDSIVYGITYEARDPERAADVANAIASLFVEASVARRNTQARRTTEFLRKALERNERDLDEVTREISAFRQEHRGVLPEEQTMVLRKLEMLSAQRDSITQQIAAKRDRIASISSQGGDSALSETGILLSELRRELARQSAAHTDEHPNVIALRARIERLEAEGGESGLNASASYIIQDERREISRLQARLAQVEQEIVEMDARADQAPLVAEKLDALMRREVVLREDYLEAARKVEEAELAENLESAQQGGQVSILDRAVPPSSPESTRIALVLRGMAVSLALAVGVALLLELLDPVIVSARQVEKETGISILGSIPRVV